MRRRELTAVGLGTACALAVACGGFTADSTSVRDDAGGGGGTDAPLGAVVIAPPGYDNERIEAREPPRLRSDGAVLA